MFMSVDLPEPDAPMMATNSPAWIFSEMPRSTGVGAGSSGVRCGSP